MEPAVCSLRSSQPLGRRMVPQEEMGTNMIMTNVQ